MTRDELKQLVNYNPETGKFTRRFIRPAPVSRISIGDEIGHKTGKGYLVASLDRKKYFLHRMAWLYVYGRHPEGEIDHINRNKSDNRISNLRECTRGQNLANQSIRTDNTSGTIGVYWSKQAKKWQAYINFGNSRIHLGLHDKIDDAVQARLAAEKKYLGEFAPQVAA